MKQAFNSLKRRMQLLVSRAVVNVINDSLKTQNLQISMLADDDADDVERFQNYGHSSVPPAGSEAIVLSVGGMRQQLVAVVVDNKGTRLNAGKPGDSALYHMEGHYFLLTEEGEVRLKCKRYIIEAEEVVIDAPETRMTGHATILGGSNTTGTSEAADHISAGISGKDHTHREHDGPTTGRPQ
ncbi:Mu-like prophage FluMu protein gp45 [Leminorella grimontii]|uniref:Mu-like prophage FluMu protein gp45 n=1 Tax=Leminorella grimontii TaxID=82981 RepID=A0AAV5N9G8_9GAMM|nr:phage baseplate assembly protein V [Leminorella grimontii]GKX57608.1 Mu-like prophage FluMu protein gp45 [Leminorella grimontii]VFS55826.1 Mu-like prophage protein gp45 [Leminorella grimontii]